MFQPMTNDQLTATVQPFLSSLLPPSGHPHFNMYLPPELVCCDGADGSLVLAFHTQPWMSNPMGVLHGGLSAAMVDTAMGITCGCQRGQPTPTISMTLNYARPVPLNAAVYIHTRLIRCGGTTAQTTAELYLPEAPEQVLVSATGVYYVK